MEKLLFIYNARSGKRNAYLDALHKILKPETYSCSLCKITYGNFGEKKAWKQFRDSSQIEMEFLHFDEFEKAYASKFGYKFEYPVILSASEQGLQIYISKAELEMMSAPAELIALIEERKDSGKA